MIELLQQLGVEIAPPDHEHSSEGWTNIQCPYCDTSSFRMGVNNRSGVFNCYACGPRPPGEVLALLTGHQPAYCWRVYYNARQAGPCEPGLRREVAGKLHLPVGLRPLTPRHCYYLEERGFIPSQIVKKWGVQALTGCGAYSWSLFIPLTYRGEMVAWTVRYLRPDKVPKYRNANADQCVFPVGNVLYGFDLVGNAVVIVEGPLDAWAIGPGAVALCGTGCGPVRLNQLASVPVRYVCLDAEEDAQRRARELCKQLSAFPGETRNIVLESGKDASRVCREELQHLRGLLK